MKVLHRIAFCATSAQRRQLEWLGLQLPPGLPTMDSEPLLAFDLAEDDPNWSEISLLLQQWRVSASHVRTTFSKEEIVHAEWLELSSDWHNGYPQPDEDNFGYLATTYDLTNWCERCGTGAKQKAPFQIKGEPKWGRRGLFQLHWVMDEFFVRPELWAEVFKPAGIGCRPVLNTKGKELSGVVQLVVEHTVGVLVDGLTEERCPPCGRTRYRHVVKGLFPALREQPRAAMVRTTEYFGSGGQAETCVLVSSEIAHVLVGVRGAVLRPVQDAPERPAP